MRFTTRTKYGILSLVILAIVWCMFSIFNQKTVDVVDETPVVIEEICYRDDPGPLILENSVSSYGQFVADDGFSLIEEFNFSDGQKGRLINTGCEYFTLRIQKEYHDMQTVRENDGFWFSEAIILLEGIEKVWNFSIYENLDETLSVYVSKSGELKYDEWIYLDCDTDLGYCTLEDGVVSQEGIPGFIGVVEPVREGGIVTLEVYLSIGPL
jgi:hypothetical protein